VLELAEISAISGAKQASSMLPFTHPVAIDQILARASLADYIISVYCFVSAFDKRSAATYAMAGVNQGLLALYDLCKNINPGASFRNVQLLFSQNEHQGVWLSPDTIPEEAKSLFVQPEKILTNVRAAVISASDKALQGLIPDVGDKLTKQLEAIGAQVVDYKLISADVQLMTDYIKQLVKEKNPHLVMIRGATGVSLFDQTPLAMEAICQRMIPGFGELMRTYTSKFTAESWIGCCGAGIFGNTLIVSIPGQEKAIDELMRVLPEPLADALQHLSETSLATADTGEEKIIDAYRLWP
jgi:molybdopterin adenylyltransferase